MLKEYTLFVYIFMKEDIQILKKCIFELMLLETNFMMMPVPLLKFYSCIKVIILSL